MNKDIARMRCPVCGTQTGARKNKNGIIYANCPNSHQTKLNKDDSREVLEALKKGQNWNNGNIFIYSNYQQTERKQENDGTNQSNSTGNGTAGASINYGRNDGQPAANPTVDNGTTGDDESDDDDAFGFGLI